MRTPGLIAAVALPCALILSSCSSDSGNGESSGSPKSPTGTAAPDSAAPSSEGAAASSPADTSAAPSSAGADSPSADSSGTSSSGTDSSSAAGTGADDSGAADSAGVIKKGASGSLPKSVTGWKLTGPAYTKGSKFIGVTVINDAKFEDVDKVLKGKKKTSGTGACGTAASPDYIVCYLKAEDGVLGLTAAKKSADLPAMVSFANDLTTQLGTTS